MTLIIGLASLFLVYRMRLVRSGLNKPVLLLWLLLATLVAPQAIFLSILLVGFGAHHIEAELALQRLKR